MSNQIKVEFYRNENFVYGRVLEIPEKIRGTEKLITDGKHIIWSRSYPYLEENELFLKGNNKEMDNDWFSCQFTTPQEASETIEAFKALIYRWNNPILNESERKYLSAVIKPWKSEVTSITKLAYNNETQNFIQILTKSDYATLPFFTKGTLYKGMELSKNYTLEELGLE